MANYDLNFITAKHLILARFNWDVSYMGIRVSNIPVNIDGKPNLKMLPIESAGSWTKLKYIVVPDIETMKTVMLFHGLDTNDKQLNSFILHILIHELAHEVYNVILDKKTKIYYAKKLHEFSTDYTKRVIEDKLDEEKFCEYVAVTCTENSLVKTQAKSSLEELNIEKVARLEDSDTSEDDFDELADKVSTDNLINELDKPEDVEPDTSDATPDKPDADTATSSDTEATTNEDKEQTDSENEVTSDEDTKSEEVANTTTESFIDLFSDTSKSYIATEDAFIQNCASKLGIAIEGNGFLYNNLIHNNDTGKDGLLLKLRDLGVEYGKVAIVHVAKGLLYSLTKTYEALIAGSKIFIRYSFRMVKNYKRYLNRIQKAKELLKLAATKPAKEIKETYNNSAVIATLKIGNDLDFNKNVENLYNLNEHYNDKLIDYVKSNITGIRTIIRSVMSDGDNIPVIKTIDHMPLNGFKAGPSTDYIRIMRYGKDLPGDRYYAMAIPATDINDYEDVKKAYSDSKSYISIDDGLVSRTVAACNYPDLRYITNFLDTLDKLCKKGMELERYFKSIEGYKSKLKPDLQSYIKFIVSDKDKMTVKQSLAELIGLKTNFLDRTVISGSMHIHNVNTNVLSSGLTIVKATLEKHMLD